MRLLLDKMKKFCSSDLSSLFGVEFVKQQQKWFIFVTVFVCLFSGFMAAEI